MHEQRLKPRDPDFDRKVRAVFKEAPFIRYVGYELESVEPGRLVTTLTLGPDHQQQNGYVHAGVVGTMADHSAGGAAATLIPDGQAVLTIEYKINLLRPGVGESLVCRSEVLKNGKTVIVADSYVYGVKGGREKLIARSTVTLAVVAMP